MSNQLTFNIAGYSKLLEQGLTSGYVFKPLTEAALASAEKLICLLHHDIDTSLAFAYQMAQIEANLGVQATYYVMLRSPVYNVFARFNHQFVEKILALGHHIGLHYDEGFYPTKESSLQSLVETEVSILEKMFGVSIESVSFHQPSKAIIENKFTLSNYINTYDKVKLKEFHYLSDSNKIWKDVDPLTLFQQKIYPKIQLVIHPLWWVAQYEESTELTWNRAILSNLHLMQEQILATERAFGNRRIIDIKET